MFIRTNVGRLYQSFSEDGGDHWSLAEPTELASGDVKCYLGRLRTTGDLIAVWSQSSTEELESGYSRGRLTLAVSRDEAKTWENFRTIERSEGMQPIARVAAPPVRHVRPRVKLGEFPDGYDRNHYPTLAFVQQKVVIAYRSGVLPPDRKVKLLAIPGAGYLPLAVRAARRSAQVDEPLRDIRLANAPTARLTTNDAGLTHMKLTGSSSLPVLTSIPKIGPEKAIRVAVATPQRAPAAAPNGVAKGTKRERRRTGRKSGRS